MRLVRDPNPSVEVGVPTIERVIESTPAETVATLSQVVDDLIDAVNEHALSTVWLQTAASLLTQSCEGGHPPMNGVLSGCDACVARYREGIRLLNERVVRD
jgi:hypothetical protein